MREVEEETNLLIEPLEVFVVHSNFHNPQQHTVGIWFLSKVVSGTPLAGDDANEIGWFELSDPPSLASSTDKLVLKELLQKAEVNISDKIHKYLLK